MARLVSLIVSLIMLFVSTPAHVGQYDAIFSQIQGMLAQSAKNNEAGVNTARQQLESLSKPARQNIKEARILNQQGLDALKINDYAAAVTAFQKAHETDPADVEISGNLGYANLKLGQLKRAEHQLIYAISLSPARSSSWFNLGQVYGAQNQVEKATGAFANAYRFSQNRTKTEEFMRQAITNPEHNEATHTALQMALALFSL